MSEARRRRIRGRYYRSLDLIGARNRALTGRLFANPDEWLESWAATGPATIQALYVDTGRRVAPLTGSYMGAVLGSHIGATVGPVPVDTARYATGRPPGVRDMRATVLGSSRNVTKRIEAGAKLADAVGVEERRWLRQATAEPHRVSRQIVADEAVESKLWRGWRRMPEPGACDFCVLAAAEGRVIRTQDPAGPSLSYHNGCRCQAEPVPGDVTSDAPYSRRVAEILKLRGIPSTYIE